MARGLFITGFTISEVLAIQQRAKELLLEGKTIMNSYTARRTITKQLAALPMSQHIEFRALVIALDGTNSEAVC